MRRLIFLYIIVLGAAGLAQTTIATQGFETGNTWTIATGSTNVKNTTGSSDTPALQRILAGTYSWQCNNGTSTLELSPASVSGYASVQVKIRLSSPSGNTGNGSDAGDSVQFFVALNGASFGTVSNVTVNGNTNARWGYTGTLTVTGNTTSRTLATAPQVGTSTNNYSTVIITIPDGTSQVALKIVAKNNDGNELWCVDNIELIGTLSNVTAPTTQASEIVFSDVQTTQMTAGWTNGNGTKRVVKINTSDSFTAPADGTDPTANTVYGGSGEQVVYNGSGSSVTVTYLSAGTAYYFRVFEYNGTGSNTKYLTTTANNNPASQATLSSPYSSSSDIITNPSFSYSTGVAYAAHQETTLTGTSFEAAQFQIRDGGASADADNYPTTLTSLTLSVSGSSYLRRIAIFDGATLIAETAAASSVTFSSITGLSADDNSTKTFSVRVSFLSTVTDNQQFSFTVTAASASTSGSTFATPSAGGAATPTSGGENKISVTATKLSYTRQPSNTAKNVAMSPAVAIEAIDDLNNRDLDIAGTASITSTGTMQGTPTATLASGTGTYGNIIHTIAVSGATLTASFTGLTSIVSSTFNILGGMSELVVPKYFGAKSASGTNNQRTPVAVCLEFDGLTANQAYDLKTGMETSSSLSGYGAGTWWNGSSFSTSVISNAFTTNSAGESGPVWIFLEPTNNSSRFGAGQAHYILIGLAHNGSTMPSTPNYVSTKTMTALDISSTAATADATDDGAYVKGDYDASFSGKYFLLFDNVDGNGSPLYAYQARSASPTNAAMSTMPTSIDSIYQQLGSAKGVFAGIIPASTRSTSGVQRIEFRNADNTLYKAYTSSTGIWAGNVNTTTAARNGVLTLEAPRLTVNAAVEGLYNGTTQTDDSLTVTLKSSSAPYSVVESKNLLLKSGSALAKFLNVDNSSSYYLVVSGKNTIETWSAVPVSYTNYTASYDFTTSASQAYGNNLTQVGTKWCLYSGDVNQDGKIDYTDLRTIDAQMLLYTKGVTVYDLNGDGIVDFSDLKIADNNSHNNIIVHKP